MPRAFGGLVLRGQERNVKDGTSLIRLAHHPPLPATLGAPLAQARVCDPCRFSAASISGRSASNLLLCNFDQTLITARAIRNFPN